MLPLIIVGSLDGNENVIKQRFNEQNNSRARAL